MAYAIRTAADVCNLSLVRIGSKEQLGSIYDGTLIARKFLDCYSQALDDILREGDWQFARRDMPLVLQKSAPPGGYFPPDYWSRATYPPPQFLFQYEYPAVCLKARAIRPPPSFVIDFDPRPINFSEANDETLPSDASQKCILTNQPDAMLVYTAQVIDPRSWEPTFIEAFASKLGRLVAPVALGNADAVKLAGADAVEVMKMAEQTQG